MHHRLKGIIIMTHMRLDGSLLHSFSIQMPLKYVNMFACDPAQRWLRYIGIVRRTSFNTDQHITCRLTTQLQGSGYSKSSKQAVADNK